MTDNVETRRRRATYRACHRGHQGNGLDPGPLRAIGAGRHARGSARRFERLLALPDPDLQDMILHPDLAPAGEFADIVVAMRASTAWGAGDDRRQSIRATDCHPGRSA